MQATVGGKEVVIRTHRDRADKHGRWLAVVHFKDAAGAVTKDLYDGRISLKFLRGSKEVLTWCRRRLR